MNFKYEVINRIGDESKDKKKKDRDMDFEWKSELLK